MLGIVVIDVTALGINVPMYLLQNNVYFVMGFYYLTSVINLSGICSIVVSTKYPSKYSLNTMPELSLLKSAVVSLCF